MKFKVFAILFICLGLILIIEAQEQIIINAGFSGQNLLTYVQDNYTPQHTLGYTDARDTLYGVIDADSARHLETIYSGFTIVLEPEMEPDPSKDADSKGVNCEHSWPQSMGAGDEPQRSDMHHLFPCKSNVNSSRGNAPFGDIPDALTDRWYYQGQILTTIPDTLIDYYSEKENDGSSMFEPREKVKGDIARAMFYFYTIYHQAADSLFWQTQESALLKWHYCDPVDSMEYSRTWKIAAHQDSLPNPFVLDSSLARRIWQPEDTKITQTAPINHAFTLYPAYPNPFNNLTNIAFELDRTAKVKITVHDLSGRVVGQLLNQEVLTGYHKYRWQPTGIPSGFYFYRLSINGRVTQRKCLYLK